MAAAVASRDAKTGVKALRESSVTFDPRDEEFEQVTRLWLSDAGMKRGMGSWRIKFNYKVMPTLVALSSQFTTYSLYDCGQLNSVKVIRLYESLCQLCSTDTWVTDHECLCERFMLADSQRSNKAEMKRTFLEPTMPAIKKFNEKTLYRTQDDSRVLFSVMDQPVAIS